jgi:hypothetical protein
VEALLDDDDESFLFASLADNDHEAGLGLRSDPSYNLFDDWRMDVEPNLDDILNEITDEPVAVFDVVKVRPSDLNVVSQVHNTN